MLPDKMLKCKLSQLCKLMQTNAKCKLNVSPLQSFPFHSIMKSDIVYAKLNTASLKLIYGVKSFDKSTSVEHSMRQHLSVIK